MISVHHEIARGRFMAIPPLRPAIGTLPPKGVQSVRTDVAAELEVAFVDGVRSRRYAGEFVGARDRGGHRASHPRHRGPGAHRSRRPISVDRTIVLTGPILTGRIGSWIAAPSSCLDFHRNAYRWAVRSSARWRRASSEPVGWWSA